MSGQKKLSKKDQVAQYIASTRPYEKKEPLNFDLRGYAAYVKINNLSAGDITPEIMQRFQSKQY